MTEYKVWFRTTFRGEDSHQFHTSIECGTAKQAIRDAIESLRDTYVTTCQECGWLPATMQCWIDGDKKNSRSVKMTKALGQKVIAGRTAFETYVCRASSGVATLPVAEVTEVVRGALHELTPECLEHIAGGHAVWVKTQSLTLPDAFLNIRSVVKVINIHLASESPQFDAHFREQTAALNPEAADGEAQFAKLKEEWRAARH